MSAAPRVAVENGARHPGASHDTVYRCIHGKGLATDKLGRLGKLKLSGEGDRAQAAGALHPDHERWQGTR